MSDYNTASTQLADLVYAQLSAEQDHTASFLASVVMFAEIGGTHDLAA